MLKSRREACDQGRLKHYRKECVWSQVCGYEKQKDYYKECKESHIRDLGKL